MQYIYNIACEELMKSIEENTIDIILSSPYYNTNKKSGRNVTLNNVRNSGYTHVRYDILIDNLTNDEYAERTVNWFKEFDRLLKPNGVILWNLSYGSENTECMFLTVAEIIQKTNFTIADRLIWKKKTALPNNMSPNKCTRICEDVFVFCRKDEIKTFHMNKQVSSIRSNGQRNYENVYNFFEAKNNDGSCNLNKATFSTEMVSKLLSLYGKDKCVVYDPFLGTGTTANACVDFNYDCIGSEISEEQCWYAYRRILKKTNLVELNGKYKIPNNIIQY